MDPGPGEGIPRAATQPAAEPGFAHHVRCSGDAKEVGSMDQSPATRLTSRRHDLLSLQDARRSPPNWQTSRT